MDPDECAKCFLMDGSGEDLSKNVNVRKAIDSNEDLQYNHPFQPQPSKVDILNDFSSTETQMESVPLGHVHSAQILGNSLEEQQKKVTQKDASCCKWKRYFGICLAFLSAMMFSLNSLLMKMLTGYHSFLLAFWMFLGMTLLFLPILVINVFVRKINLLGITDNSTKRKIYFFVWLRAFCGSMGMTVFFFSLEYLSVADASVIACSSPIFVYLVAFLLLDERYGLIPFFATVLAIGGVLVVVRPPLITGVKQVQTSDLIGCALAFFSMLFITIVIISMRYLKEVNHIFMNFLFGLWGTSQSLLFVALTSSFRLPVDMKDTFQIFGCSFATFLGMSSLAVALQIENAGPVALIGTSEIIFAFMWQFIILGIPFDIISILGAVLVLTGAVLTILRKWIHELPSNHFLKKRLSILSK